jgi:hypothetical protein
MIFSSYTLCALQRLANSTSHNDNSGGVCSRAAFEISRLLVLSKNLKREPSERRLEVPTTASASPSFNGMSGMFLGSQPTM